MKITKEKSQLVLTVILGIILILLSVRAYHQLQAKRPMRSWAGAVAAPAVSADQAAPSYVALAEEAGQTSIERDPVFPASKVSAASIVLNGIFWDEVNPTAVINNEILQAGQSVNGKVIMEIQSDKVILNDGSRNIELKMYE